MWRWLKRLFRIDHSKPSRTYESHGEETSSKPKFKPAWGFIIPHTAKAGGAANPDKTWDEYQYGTAMAPQIGKPFADRNSGGVKGAAKNLKRKGCNASLEGHLNSFNGQVQGAEILVLKGDDLSKYYAELFLAAYKAKYPGKNIRGVKEMKKGGRGAGNLIAAKKAGMEIALLSEMFFIDSEWITPEEMAQFWAANLK